MINQTEMGQEQMDNKIYTFLNHCNVLIISSTLMMIKLIG